MHTAGPGKTVDLPLGSPDYLVLGDDTAIPAIARLLEELPETARGQVFIQVPGPEYIYWLDAPPLFAVEWLIDDRQLPSKRGPLLALLETRTHLDKEVFVWVAGEQSEVQAIRRFLVKTHGIPRDAISFTGYWKRGDSGLTDPA